MAIITGQAGLTVVAQINASGCSATYCYTPTNGIKIVGCSVTSYSVCNYNEYVNYLMYICETAKRTGKIETVAIKKISYVKKYDYYIPVYLDSFNRTWFERDLCDLGGIQDLVLAYEEKQAAFLADYLRTNCNIGR